MIGSGGFMDSLNRQRKDCVQVEKLEIQKDLFVKLLVKAFMFYLTLNSKGIWMVRHSFLLCFSFFMLEFIIQIAMLLILDC
jgi:hypothetical protein